VNVYLCVPTLNAAATLVEFAGALQTQTLRPSGILILDSSSTDNTPNLAQQAGYRLITIPRADFRHGGTRQLAADLAADSDILVYLTQDSLLADPNALANLISAFDDPSVGAAFGRQLPRPGANPIEAHARLFNYPPVSSIRTPESVATMGFKSIFFSNSFGAYRRTALEQVGGFPKELNFGEDTVVAARLLQHKWKIAYVADALAYHSHGYTLREEFQRYHSIGQLHGSESRLVRDFGKATGEGSRFVASEMRHLLRHAPWLVPEALLRSGLKYLGYQRGLHSTQR
jgi:rhamnosyltransferase